MGSFFIWTAAWGREVLISSKAHAVVATHLRNDQEPLVLEGLFSLPCLLHLQHRSPTFAPWTGTSCQSSGGIR